MELLYCDSVLEERRQIITEYLFITYIRIFANKQMYYVSTNFIATKTSYLPPNTLVET